MTQVVIIGGGITGLAAAWELQQRAIGYTLLEASDRLGGKIVTDRADGFIIEGGADSFLTQKPWAWKLCREIGLDLMTTNEQQRTAYVLRGGKLHPMPRGMRLIVPTDPDGLMESTLLSDEGKRRMLDEVNIPPRLDESDESLASFIRRRFGDEAHEVFGESLLAGIYTGDSEKLSIKAAYPNYPRLERQYGSLIRGMQATPTTFPDPSAPKSMFVSPRGGVIELIERLQACLTGEVRLGQAVARIDPDGTITTSTGDVLHPDAVIITTSAPVARTMLIAAAPDLAEALGDFHIVSSGTISLGFHADEIDHPLNGTGFVIPHREPSRILASTWSSTKLPGRAPADHVLIRVFVGGHRREADVTLPDAELISIARAELQRIMGIDAEPVISRVFRWHDANPQYEIGHVEHVARLKALCPPWLHLAGCAYSGVGIPDCVRQGREAAQQAVV